MLRFKFLHSLAPHCGLLGPIFMVFGCSFMHFAGTSIIAVASNFTLAGLGALMTAVSLLSLHDKRIEHQAFIDNLKDRERGSGQT